MLIHQCPDKGLALYIDAEELAACGFSEVCEKAARVFTEEALNDLGLPVSALEEIEAYQSGTGALIFASLRREGTTACFAFGNFDDLLFAAKCAKKTPAPRSSLLRCGGKYMLMVQNASNALIMLMGEFGETAPVSDSLWRHWREQGELLIDSRALERLSP